MAINNETAVVAWEPDQKELDIYRKHYAPQGTTDIEWEIFLQTCRTYRVSPIRKQIYLVGRWDSQKKRLVNTPQVSIGTLRLMALRTHEFEGTTEPEWGDEEGNWYTLWPKKLGPHPYAARIGVYRHGFRVPVWGVAYFHEVAQKKKEGGLTKFWQEMGIHMVIKCALADALRGAFEEECGGIYIHEEMNQADSDTVVVSVLPEVAPDENEALRETASHRTARPTGTRQDAQQTASTHMNLSDIPSVRMLRETAATLNLEWETVLDGAFERSIREGKVTRETLLKRGNELPPEYCKRIASYLQSKQAA